MSTSTTQMTFVSTLYWMSTSIEKNWGCIN